MISKPNVKQSLRVEYMVDSVKERGLLSQWIKIPIYISLDVLELYL